MIHKFKFGVHRFVYDSGSGEVHEVDELGYKMVDYIVTPMASECPSALRYDLAKYDSNAISETYDRLYALWRDGKLYAEDKPLPDAGIPEATVGASVRETPDGLVIARGELGGEELKAELEELTRRIKAAVRARKGSIFAPVRSFGHGFVCCADCYAHHLCSLERPGTSVCELERLRVDAELAADALGLGRNIIDMKGGTWF